MFASAGTSLKLHNWADNQLQPISVYKPKKTFGITPRLTDISWCHDNCYIAVLQEENQPQILSSKDRTNLNLVHTIQALKRTSALSFKRHTKRTLALGNTEGDVVLYDTKNRNIARRITSLASPVRLLEFNCTDERLAVVTERSLCIFFDLEGINNFVKEAEYPELCSSVTFHANCPHTVAAGTFEGAVALRDLEKDEIITTWHKHSASISGISFTNHKVMVTTGLDHKICVFDHSTSDCLFRMNLHQPVTSSALSADDNYLAAGLEDGYVYIYDLREPLKPLACDRTHNGPVNKIFFERSLPCREILPDRSSVTTLHESDYGEGRSEVSHSVGDAEKQECFEGKLKRDLLKSVKTHMGYLEGQLAEHCAKFQVFVNNEFEAIHGAMARWDVFNVAETCDGVQGMEPADVKTVKSASNK